MLSIKYKFPLVLVLIITLFGFASSWVSNHVIMPPFQEMDEQRITKNMQRNINAMLDSIEEVERLTVDWGMWDDAYGFVKHNNRGFIESNLNVDTFKNNAIDAILFFDLDSRLLWGGVYDPRSSVVVPIHQEGSLIAFEGFSLDLSKIRRTGSLSSGFYLANNTLVMYALSPISDTNRTQSPDGNVMMLRKVTTEMISRFQKQTESAFSVVPLNGRAPDNEEQRLIQKLAMAGQSVLIKHDKDLVAHNVIPTADGGHLLITVQEKKAFAVLAKTLIDEVIVWLVVGGIIIFISSVFIVRTYVVSPVLKVTRHVREISDSKDYSRRLNSQDDDEIGALSRCIDGFMETLSDSLSELNRLNQVQQSELNHRKDLEFNLQSANEKLKRLASLDGLTGLANRRIFDEKLVSEWHRMQRHQRPMALVLMDIDHFKKFNDSYGHTKGDECLIKVARALRLLFKRSEDLVARYGGEEFAVILPECSPETACHLGEEIVNTISRLYITHKHSETGVVTCSVGVCSVLPDSTLACEELLKQADENLYRAKATGRNQSWFTAMRGADSRVVPPQNSESFFGFNNPDRKGLSG